MTTFRKHRTTPKLIGPSFIALQVRDLEASKTFYVEQIGLTASPHNPPGAVIFNTKPVPFAIRTPMVDLDATSRLDGACLFGSPQRMPTRSTRNWWRKAYPSFSLLPMDRLGDSSLSVTRMGTQLPSTQKSQSRQRQRWMQAADI